ncbi:SDR family NAD(P)-dependent oxidoreductase [Sphingomonas azotifigens]|uniref:SDR family NAD(P)-dependent oxidoreductase n=1 Tax=Sphingomonas azotifigens TaxID=330920 RepID=UPI0009FBB1D7|nr:SDR family NAD(P)-dependent oxidoreductase [Sphingomonas azotifigens]
MRRQQPPRPVRDPLTRPVERQVPPAPRSRAMHAMSARAAQGRFVLQRCTECEAVTYPPRDICPVCWGELAWADQPRGATILAATMIRVTTDLYFHAHLPWRIGTVALDAGPVAIVHLHRDLAVGDRATMRLMLDKGGNAALFALPEQEGNPMADPQWREFVVPVQDRAVLVTDGDTALGKAVVRALVAAGAHSVLVGTSTPGVPMPAEGDPEQVRQVPLDLTDSQSVTHCIAQLGGPIDIVVNTARFVRPGGVSAGGRLLHQQRALDVGVLGLLRLAEAVAPVLAGRPAGAFVDLLSIHALVGDARFAGFSAAEAARHSLLQSFRHEMRATGVRVLSVFFGAIDDEDHQSVPFPHIAPDRLAQGVIEALASGREQQAVGDVARDLMARWLADPATTNRENNL